MRVLIVAPVNEGSGETVTARYLAQSLARREHEVFFLASKFAARFLADEFAGAVTELGPDGSANVALWKDALQQLRPHVIVFADYSLMFWPRGVVPLANEPDWLRQLEDEKACLVTLDHFGFAQGEMTLFFGPPHLANFHHRFAPIPDRMKIMLPCPMHEPWQVVGRKGQPFRYLCPPRPLPDALRGRTHARYLDGNPGLLLFHIVSSWAWQSARRLGLNFYDQLGELLNDYLSPLGRPVTVVSLNNGVLLRQPERSSVRIVNVGPMSPPEFDALLFSSDLLLTENKLSISIGKAVCGLQPAAAFVNSFGILDLLESTVGRLRELVLAIENNQPGSIYPFDVYPTGMKDVLPWLVLYRDNSLTRAFTEVEVFGGHPTQQALAALLTDDATRRDLRDRQQTYVDRLSNLPDGATVLAQLLDGGGG
jgi:Family of unknown function (DUF6365)